MTDEELLEQVAAHAGCQDHAEAERAIRAVFEALAERLSRSEAVLLAEALPPRLAEPLRHGVFDREFDLEDLYQRVARNEGVKRNSAVEHTQTVCQAVADAIPGDVLRRLQQLLPEPLAALFLPRAPVDDFAPRRTTPRRDTLAEGRPGSRHPISEARADHAHGESVVRSDNPHADTKLSSAKGLTQEREQESLATGHSGSDRPLSERR
jgi:uncharacterized protein (DUF2267 family)